MTDAALAPAVLESPPPNSAAPGPLIEACGLPELGSRLSGLSVRIDDSLNRPFMHADGIITIGSAPSTTVTGAALALREAIELLDLADGGAAWPERILSHATAIVYGATVLSARDEQDALESYSSVAGYAAQVLALHDNTEPLPAARTIARHIADFLLQRDEIQSSCSEAELALAAQALPFAVPTDVLLTSGGDDRQTVDWSSGINSYGVPPSPTPWTRSFGSCTASSPTARGLMAADELRHQLIGAALAKNLDHFVTDHSTRMRRTLLAALGVTSDVQVVFTPSGTDAELIPLLLAQRSGAPVHTIIVGPVEIGSGSLNAATGLHFSGRLPSGEAAVQETPIAGLDTGRVTTTTIDVRHADSRMRTADELEAAVETAIATHAETCQTLVHVVEGTKTGIRLPRRETVRRWRTQYRDRLDVVVDAAQMRIDQQTAVGHLQDGNPVIVTGSKFFGGPPFSGAVIIPSSLVPRLQTGQSLPTGVAGYLSQADVPVELFDLHAAARPELNAGLLLRWEAALSEMRSFHNASPEIRDEVLRNLVAGLRATLERAPGVELVESPYTQIPEADQRGLDDLPTIFTFVVRDPNGSELTMELAKDLQRRLMQNMSDEVPVDDPVLRRTYQLGQPVKVRKRGDKWIGGLRIAIGAPTVSEVVFDHTRGRKWNDRVDQILDDCAEALRKLRLILDNADAMPT